MHLKFSLPCLHLVATATIFATIFDIVEKLTDLRKNLNTGKIKQNCNITEKNEIVSDVWKKYLRRKIEGDFKTVKSVNVVQLLYVYLSNIKLRCYHAVDWYKARVEQN